MFLRKFARPSMTMMMSAAAKESSSSSRTAGPVAELIKIYKTTINEIQSIPEDEGYRKALEATTRERLNICLEEQDPQAIEERIGSGKLEDILLDAKFEYKIVSNLLEWDPWGINEAYVCDVIDHKDQVPKAEPPGPIPDELYARLKALAKATCEKDEPKPRGISEDSYSDEPDKMFSSDNHH